MTNLFISLAISEGNVLVHWFGCGGFLIHSRWGCSRSPAVIIAYLISQLDYTYEDAVEHVKDVHFWVNLNSGIFHYCRLILRFR